MGQPDRDDRTALYEGLRVQLEMLGLWEGAGEKLGGWKVGLTSGANRDLMGKGFRPFGFLLASRIYDSGSVLSRIRIGACQVEPEICLTIRKKLGGSNLEVGEVKDAVSEVAPSFEINELRRSMKESPSSISIADGLSNWGIVVCEGGPVSGADLTQTEVVVRRNDEEVSSTVLGRAMDDPYKSLVELCTTLDRFGLSLQPGQRVITGAFSKDAVAGTGSWVATFGGIGTVEITFD